MASDILSLYFTSSSRVSLLFIHGVVVVIVSVSYRVC